MPIESREILKTYFQTGDVPTQEQFWSLIESYIHRTDDGVYIYKFLDKATKTELKRFGIGIVQPAAPLGILSQGKGQQLISLLGALDKSAWTISLSPDEDSNSGYAITQEKNGGINRFFIQASSGNVGMGTTEPESKLHLSASTPADVMGLTTLNTATAVNQGWLIGHLHDGLETRDGAFVIAERTAIDQLERLIIRNNGNVGIGEAEPDAPLHVSRDINSATASVELIPGSGIGIFGPITENVGIDFRGIQSRKGSYIGSTLVLEVTDLNLQRLGGKIIIHGADEIDEEAKAVITEDAWMGLGVAEPLERLEIDGAIKIGNTLTNNDGTIRYTGSDFEGKTAFGWVSLTEGFNPWTTGPAANQIYFDAQPNPHVSIGTTSAVATFVVEDKEQTNVGNTAVLFDNQSVNTNGGADDNRVVMEVKTSSLWGGNAASKNIGIYVSSVNGQTATENNLSAVLNGNMLVGNLVAGQAAIGTNGVNVLAMQTGVIPDSSPAATAQLFAATYNNYSTLHVLRENGDLVKLYKESALTAADNTLMPDTFDAAKVIIENMRTRINELESRLQAIGLLGTQP